MKNNRFIISGGGTGGHIYPALSIANKINESFNNAEIKFVGAIGRMEMNIVPKHGYNIQGLWISGLQRSFSLKNIVLPLKLIISLIQSIFILIKYKPKFVIGTVGFASFPIVFISSILRIPTLIQEQNSFPGLVTRMFGSKAEKVFLGFENAKNYLKNSDILFTGNPIYGHTQKDISISLDHKKRTLMILGGSQGSVLLNSIISECIDNKILKNINIIWIAGLKNYDKYKHYNTDSIKVLSFVDNMPYLYDKCDLIVSRSGAMTVSEILQFKKPSILIPFRFSAEDHQVFNAKYLEEKFAALLMQEKDLDSTLLSSKINEICENDRIYNSMKDNIEKIDIPDSVNIISKKIMEHLYAV